MNPQSTIELDRQVVEIIRRVGLSSDRNVFFLRSKSKAPVDVATALFIAQHWREITKGFMFSTITGLGAMANVARGQTQPSTGLLKALQTGFRVISDDLNNVVPDFRDFAPAGVGGIHYIWWHDSVLKPLLNASLQEGNVASAPRCLSVEELLAHMGEISGSPMGSAAQLRIVEAIALDVALSFRRIFARVAANGKPVFAGKRDLAWVDTHIRAEVAHNRQVCDDDSGMTSIADTVERELEFLQSTERSAQLWQSVLYDFAAVLKD